jgi:hypothetical protein
MSSPSHHTASKNSHKPSFFNSRSFKVIYKRKVVTFFQKNFKLLALLLLLPVFLLGLFLFGKLPVKTPHQINRADSSPQSPQWKKYSNEKYKYSFDYSTDWKLDNTNPAVVFLTKQQNRITFFDTGFKVKESTQAAKITDDFIKRNGLKKGEAQDIDSNEGFVAIKEPDPIDKKWYHYIFVPRNNILLGMQLETLDEKVKEDFDKILSSFKFE